MFASAAEARAFLATGRGVWPADPFSPDADEFRPNEAVHVEPLATLELRSSLLDALVPADARELEGAARFVTRRPLMVLRPQPRRAPLRGQAQPALPLT